jgi:hypothetical protein
MSTLSVERRPDLPPAAAAPSAPMHVAPEHGGGGFVDCRGVFHAWDGEDD